jgi:hypothetical protein
MRWIVLVGLIGCGGSGRWVKPGSTSADFANDKWDCSVRAKYLAREGHGWFPLWKECMRDHDWGEEEEQRGTPLPRRAGGGSGNGSGGSGEQCSFDADCRPLFYCADQAGLSSAIGRTCNS